VGIYGLLTLPRDGPQAGENEGLAVADPSLSAVKPPKLEPHQLPCDAKVEKLLVGGRKPVASRGSVRRVHGLGLTLEAMGCAFQNTGISRNSALWTSEEDEELRTAVSTHNGNNWKAIAEALSTEKSSIQCLHRYVRQHTPGPTRAHRTGADHTRNLAGFSQLAQGPEPGRRQGQLDDGGGQQDPGAHQRVRGGEMVPAGEAPAGPYRQAVSRALVRHASARLFGPPPDSALALLPVHAPPGSANGPTVTCRYPPFPSATHQCTKADPPA
jgi:hypothetical protein